MRIVFNENLCLRHVHYKRYNVIDITILSWIFIVAYAVIKTFIENTDVKNDPWPDSVLNTSDLITV